mgnify:CR=1 FL=1
MNVNSLTAQKLRSLREDSGMSQEELSKELKLSPSQIGRIENAKIEITLNQLQLYSDYYHRPIIELIGEKASVVVHWHQPKGIGVQNGNGNTLHCHLPPELVDRLMQIVELHK